MIVVIDYGMGNIGSILNMLRKVGVNAIATSDSNDIRNSEKIILPGVGAFNNGMQNLSDKGLIPVLSEKILVDKIPVLGICLGMQLLTKKSEEGDLPGLGFIDAVTIRFSFNSESGNYKIPHMNWNSVKYNKKSKLFNDMYEDPRFYFVHSYYVKCTEAQSVLTETEYGFAFTSSFENENIIGVQFHPEKSHKYGMKLLKNFAELY